MSFFNPIPPDLLARCRLYIQDASLSGESAENLPGQKGSVLRARVTRGEESCVRTELRSLYTTRIIVDAKPLGAVLIILEIGKRGTAPSRLVALTGDRAGEYSEGAIEAGWGAVMMEPGGGGGSAASLGVRFPNEPRRLHLNDVVSLAELVL